MLGFFRRLFQKPQEPVHLEIRRDAEVNRWNVSIRALLWQSPVDWIFEMSFSYSDRSKTTFPEVLYLSGPVGQDEFDKIRKWIMARAQSNGGLPVQELTEETLKMVIIMKYEEEGIRKGVKAAEHFTNQEKGRM